MANILKHSPRPLNNDQYILRVDVPILKNRPAIFYEFSKKERKADIGTRYMAFALFWQQQLRRGRYIDISLVFDTFGCLMPPSLDSPCKTAWLVAVAILVWCLSAYLGCGMTLNQLTECKTPTHDNCRLPLILLFVSLILRHNFCCEVLADRVLSRLLLVGGEG
jgi:hypothetical protein